MKTLALLIGILSLAVATLADNRIKSANSFAAPFIETACSDSFQKPKGDELTAVFSQTYPLSPTGRVSIANINGDVHINAWDGNSVKVDAIKRAYSPQRLSDDLPLGRPAFRCFEFIEQLLYPVVVFLQHRCRRV